MIITADEMSTRDATVRKKIEAYKTRLNLTIKFQGVPDKK